MKNMGTKSKRMRLQRRHGLSLLEVILSMAILAIALPMIGQLVNQGYRSAANARLRSDANILVDAKMAEVVTGILPLESNSGSPIADNPDWVYSVQVTPSTQVGLLTVVVTVSQATETSRTIQMSVTRSVPDPDYDPAEEEVDE